MRFLIIFVLSPFLLFSQTQIGNDIDGLAAGDNSGIVSISSDGTIVAIGAPEAGYVRIFENSTGDWEQIGNTIYGGGNGDLFGSSVSISGDGTIVAIGAPYNDTGVLDGGQVKVYENNAGVWTQLGNDINGVLEGYRMGLYLNLSSNGTTLAISGYWCCEIIHGHPSIGLTRIYENTNGDWTQIGDISTGLLGISDVILSGDGSIVTISTRGGGFWGWSNYYPGGVKVYKNIAGNWTQLGDTFVGEPLTWGIDFIHSVSLTEDGGKIAITSNGIKVYEYLVDTWTLINDTIEYENSYEFPGDVDLSNNGAVVTLSGFDNTSSETQFGFVRVYKSIAGAWIKAGIDIIGEGLGDYYHKVTLSNDADTIAIGSMTNDDNGVDSGHVRVFDLSAVLSTNDIVLSQFKLFPNPAENHFTIQLDVDSKLELINIYNNLGQLVHTTSEIIVDTSALSSGMYYVEVIMNEGKATKKLIVE